MDGRTEEVFSDVSASLHPLVKETMGGEDHEELLNTAEDLTDVNINFSKRRYWIRGRLDQAIQAKDIIRENVEKRLGGPATAEVFTDVEASLHPRIKEALATGPLEDMLTEMEQQARVEIAYSKRQYKVKGSLQNILQAQVIIRDHLGEQQATPGDRPPLGPSMLQQMPTNEQSKLQDMPPRSLSKLQQMPSRDPALLQDMTSHAPSTLQRVTPHEPSKFQRVPPHESSMLQRVTPHEPSKLQRVPPHESSLLQRVPPHESSTLQRVTPHQPSKLQQVPPQSPSKLQDKEDQPSGSARKDLTLKDVKTIDLPKDTKPLRQDTQAILHDTQDIVLDTKESPQSAKDILQGAKDTQAVTQSEQTLVLYDSADEWSDEEADFEPGNIHDRGDRDKEEGKDRWERHTPEGEHTFSEMRTLDVTAKGVIGSPGKQEETDTRSLKYGTDITVDDDDLQKGKEETDDLQKSEDIGHDVKKKGECMQPKMSGRCKQDDPSISSTSTSHSASLVHVDLQSPTIGPEVSESTTTSETRDTEGNEVVHSIRDHALEAGKACRALGASGGDVRTSSTHETRVREGTEVVHSIRDQVSASGTSDGAVGGDVRTSLPRPHETISGTEAGGIAELVQELTLMGGSANEALIQELLGSPTAALQYGFTSNSNIPATASQYGLTSSVNPDISAEVIQQLIIEGGPENEKLVQDILNQQERRRRREARQAEETMRDRAERIGGDVAAPVGRKETEPEPETETESVKEVGERVEHGTQRTSDERVKTVREGEFEAAGRPKLSPSKGETDKQFGNLVDSILLAKSYYPRTKMGGQGVEVIREIRIEEDGQADGMREEGGNVSEEARAEKIKDEPGVGAAGRAAGGAAGRAARRDGEGKEGGGAGRAAGGAAGRAAGDGGGEGKEGGGEGAAEGAGEGREVAGPTAAEGGAIPKTPRKAHKTKSSKTTKTSQTKKELTTFLEQLYLLRAAVESANSSNLAQIVSTFIRDHKSLITKLMEQYPVLDETGLSGFFSSCSTTTGLKFLKSAIVGIEALLRSSEESDPGPLMAGLTSSNSETSIEPNSHSHAGKQDQVFESFTVCNERRFLELKARYEKGTLAQRDHYPDFHGDDENARKQ